MLKFDGFPGTRGTRARQVPVNYEKSCITLKSFSFREWVPAKALELPEGWTALIEAEKQKKDIRSIVLPSHTSNEDIIKRFD